MTNIAVIQTGGKQYLVEKGTVLTIEKLSTHAMPLKKGDTVTFENVLLVDDGKKTTIGRPTVSGVKVTGTIIREGRKKKIEVVKYHPKSRYYKKRGHRQPFTEVKIESLG